MKWSRRQRVTPPQPARAPMTQDEAQRDWEERLARHARALERCARCGIERQMHRYSIESCALFLDAALTEGGES